MSYANGFDVQVFSTAVLAEVDRLTTDPVDRAHVSYYIYTHKEKYRCYNFEAEPECFGPELRVTLDEQNDYLMLCKVAEALIPEKPLFTAVDITQYLRAHPEVVSINNAVSQKNPNEL